jgi:aryl-alcohol dehydrogenase-like predicted oxidoreductase
MMSMRELGQSGIRVSNLCLGGNVFGWTADEATSFRILDAYLDGGFNFVDTADIYARWKPGSTGGDSETVLGRWFQQRKNRDRVILATKVGMEMGPGKTGLSAKYIAQAVKDSLRRLQTDYIDLYQSHKDDPNTPLDETLRAFSKLVEGGQVRVIGASNYGPERLEESIKLSRELGLPHYESLQPHYNLVHRGEYEGGLEAACQKYQLAVIPYWSLASGFLTGKYRTAADISKSARGKDATKYLDERGFRVLAALDQIAAKHKSTPTAVSLAWLMARPSITAPIASATSVEQLQELIAATRLRLSADEIKLLNTASS